MPLNGKTGFCFIALKHHSRFLLPITRVLEGSGVQIRYLTAPAEMPFELTLMEEGLPYCHTFSYLTPDVVEKTEAAYRQVRTAWREKVLTSPILHHFTLPVQDKVLRGQVENFYLFRRMFEEEKPDFVLALHELNSWGKMLGYLCHEYGVPFITLQEGLYYAPAGVYRFHTEYSTACLVWGEATRDVLVRSGGCAEKIFVIGNTHLTTALTTTAHPDAVRKTREDLRIEPGRKVVTILMGGLGYHEEFLFPTAFVDWIRTTLDVTVICKWHPVTNKTVIEQIQEGFRHIDNIRLLQEFDTYRLLGASDVCVVFGNSTTGLEALAFGKPLIEVHLAGLDYSFAAMEVAELAADLSAVPTVVQQVLAKGISPERAEKVRDYLQRNLATLDGRSVDRAVEIIDRLVAAQEDHLHRWERVAKSHLELNRKIVPFMSPLQDDQKVSSSNLTETAVKQQHALSKQHDYLCSLILPVSAFGGIEETLMSIAAHTPPEVSYECLLSSTQPEVLHSLLAATQGDIRVFSATLPNVAHLYNLAAREAKGRYLCFLPPGLVPQEGWLDALLHEFATGSGCSPSSGLRTGIVGGKIVCANGLLAHAGVAFDANCNPSLLYRYLPTTFAGANKVRRMRALTGCLLVRREAFASVGGFDEGFHHIWYDMDFCLQARLAGWHAVYTPHSLCLALGQEKRVDPADTQRFHGKWVGHLWPNEEEYWREDGLDNKKILQLYQYEVH